MILYLHFLNHQNILAKCTELLKASRICKTILYQLKEIKKDKLELLGIFNLIKFKLPILSEESMCLGLSFTNLLMKLKRRQYYNTYSNNRI